MTKYLDDKPFSSKPSSKEYRRNYDHAFRGENQKEEATVDWILIEQEEFNNLVKLAKYYIKNKSSLEGNELATELAQTILQLKKEKI